MGGSRIENGPSPTKMNREAFIMHGTRLWKRGENLDCKIIAMEGCGTILLLYFDGDVHPLSSG